MKLYHRTSREAADSILAGGFRNGCGKYMTSTGYAGVWLSDQPLDANEGAVGDVLLSVEVPETVVAPFEWIEEGKGYREYLIPAEYVNRYGPASIEDVSEPPSWAMEE